MKAPVLRRLAPAFGLCLLCPLFAQEVKRAAFDVRLTLDSIKDLAFDAMLGRKSGQPGGVLAEEYIARMKATAPKPEDQTDESSDLRPVQF